MRGCNENKESSNLVYWDPKKLDKRTIYQKLPADNFKWGKTHQGLMGVL